MTIKNNILFGLKYPEETHHLSGMLTFKSLGEAVNISGAPCIVDRLSWEDVHSGEVRVCFPFPKHRGYAPNDIQIYRRENVIANDEPIFTINNRVKVIEKFDFDKVGDLHNYVDKHGIITFQIWKCPQTATGYDKKKTAEATSNAVLEFLGRFGSELLAKYKYSSTEHYAFSDDYKAKTPGNLLHYLTFISLPNCIPIFNRKRVRGMGLIYRAIKEIETERKGVLVTASQIALILTDYLDNKFVVDGITLSNIDPFAKSSLDRIIKIVKANSGKDNKDKKKEKYKEKSLHEIIGNDSSKNLFVSAETYYVGTTSSSSTTYT